MKQIVHKNHKNYFFDNPSFISFPFVSTGRSIQQTAAIRATALYIDMANTNDDFIKTYEIEN